MRLGKCAESCKAVADDADAAAASALLHKFMNSKGHALHQYLAPYTAAGRRCCTAQH